LIRVFVKDKITGATINATSPCTAKPGTNTDASQKQKPLITREKAPKVTRLMGKDKAEKMGLTEPLINPTTRAAIIAAGKLAILTPGKIISTTSKLKAVANTVKKADIIVITQQRQNFFCSSSMFDDVSVFNLSIKIDGQIYILEYF
jgi:hypothetical protein